MRAANAFLIDLGAIWSAERRGSQWVNGLEAEARRKADYRRERRSCSRNEGREGMIWD